MNFHPWLKDGRPDSELAAKWTLELILTAGGCYKTACFCANAIGIDIEHRFPTPKDTQRQPTSPVSDADAQESPSDHPTPLS